MIKEFKKAGPYNRFSRKKIHIKYRKKFLSENGCKKYLDKEILSGIEILKERGFDNIRNFAYPYGRDSLEAKKCLSPYFDTLRTVDYYLYSENEIRNNLKQIKSFNLAKFPIKHKDMKFKIFARLVKEGKILFTHIHRSGSNTDWKMKKKSIKKLPKELRTSLQIIQKALLMGEKYNIKFLSMGELNGL